MNYTFIWVQNLWFLQSLAFSIKREIELLKLWLTLDSCAGLHNYKGKSKLLDDMLNLSQAFIKAQNQEHSTIGTWTKATWKFKRTKISLLSAITAGSVAKVVVANRLQIKQKSRREQ